MKNFVIFQLDQLASRALRVYGNNDSYTPNIDKLCESGVAAEAAYSPCPLCQPARAALWSGQYSHRNRVWSNGRAWPITPLDDTFPALGEEFRKAGYKAVHFGKKHDGGALRGFECSEERETRIADEDKRFPFNMDSYADKYTLDEAIKFISSYSFDKPLCMVVDFINPHNICGFVGKNKGPHEPFSGPLPQLPENYEFDDIINRPTPVKYLCCSHVRQAQTVGWSDDNFREYLAAYYYYLSVADRYIGEIINRLENSKIKGDITYILLSDHGDSMAARGSVTKQVTLYEEVTRVPFIFSGALVKSRGIAKGICSTLDLFPTLLSLAGIERPNGLDGVDISQILTGNTLPKREYVTSEWFTEWGYTISPGRMIRKDNVKYIRYLEDDGEELYLLDRDPFEKHNVAKDEPELLANMRALLDSYIKDSEDPFYSLPVKADKRWRSHSCGYQNHRGPTAPEELSSNIAKVNVSLVRNQ